MWKWHKFLLRESRKTLLNSKKRVLWSTCLEPECFYLKYSKKIPDPNREVCEDAKHVSDMHLRAVKRCLWINQVECLKPYFPRLVSFSYTKSSKNKLNIRISKINSSLAKINNDLQNYDTKITIRIRIKITLHDVKWKNC